MGMTEIRQPALLVVDDDKAIVCLIRQFAQAYGLKSTAAYNGREALDLLETGTYDLILTDLEMPVMDGYALLDKIKTDHRDYKVMIVSSDCDDREKFLMRGAMEAFPKPFSLKELVKRISELLQERRRAHRFICTSPEVPVMCRISGTTGDTLTGQVANISVDGALISFDDQLELPENLEVEFLTSRDTPAATVSGTLIRTLENRASEGVLAAVEFADDRDITMLEKMKNCLRLGDKDT